MLYTGGDRLHLPSQILSREELEAEIRVMENRNFLVEEVTEYFTSGYKEKRDCFATVYNYLISDKPQSKVCALFGLRRTGKTVLMEQCAESLPDEEKEKAIIITCLQGANMYEVLDFVNKKIENGYKYFFIDEITYADNFQQIGESLANYCVELKGARIVISGTDSLGISLPTANTQFCRSIMVHTTYISFAEYSRITGCNSIDEYIQKGAILEPDEFSNYYSVHRYIDTAISDNLINSLERSEGLDKFQMALTEIYEHNELKNAIERIVNKYSQDLSAKAIRKEFKSGCITTALGNIVRSKDNPDNLAVLLKEEQLNKNIAESLGIIENEKLSVNISEAHKRAIYEYLIEMDVFVSIPVISYSDGNEELRNMEMVSHPGMFRANVEHSMSELSNTENWLPNATKEQRERLLSGSYGVALGDIMENFIISDMYRLLCKGKRTSVHNLFQTDETKWYVSKLNFKNHEADMIIINKELGEAYLFEIKHSKMNAPEQSYHLENADFVEYIENNFGKIKEKAVLYMGKTDISTPVPRINAKDFLVTTYNTVNLLVNPEEYDINKDIDILLSKENIKDFNEITIG